jgi:hypothetical protein
LLLHDIGQGKLLLFNNKVTLVLAAVVCKRYSDHLIGHAIFYQAWGALDLISVNINGPLTPTFEQNNKMPMSHITQSNRLVYKRCSKIFPQIALPHVLRFSLYIRGKLKSLIRGPTLSQV